MAKQSRVYTMWCNIKARCYRETSPDYALYGGRGIVMCDEWKNDSKEFIKWANKNGYSDNLTIERIDSNSNYCPSNCKFITNEEQSLNRRTRVDNKYGVRGVSWSKKHKKLILRLSVDGKRVFIGLYNSLDDAIKAKETFMENNKNKKIAKEVER